MYQKRPRHTSDSVESYGSSKLVTGFERICHHVPKKFKRLCESPGHSQNQTIRKQAQLHLPHKQKGDWHKRAPEIATWVLNFTIAMAKRKEKKTRSVREQGSLHPLMSKCKKRFAITSALLPEHVRHPKGNGHQAKKNLCDTENLKG